MNGNLYKTISIKIRIHRLLEIKRMFATHSQSFFSMNSQGNEESLQLTG